MYNEFSTHYLKVIAIVPIKLDQNIRTSTNTFVQDAEYLYSEKLMAQVSLDTFHLLVHNTRVCVPSFSKCVIQSK